MSRNYALEGWQAAQKRRYFGWLLAGLFMLPPFSVALPLLQRWLPAPETPARVLRGSPTEAAAQQVFIAAYVSRAHARRRRKAWLGCALSFALWGGLALGSFWQGPASTPRSGAERNAGASEGQVELRGTAAAVEAERRRYAEQARAREAELREQLPARMQAIEELYDTIADTHEEVARVLVDEWEQRWARDRATLAQVTKRQVLGDIEARRELRGVESAFGNAEAEYRNAELELANARQRLAQAQAAAAR